MKVLIVAPFFPLPLDSGGAIRIYNLVRHLSRFHEITLLSYIKDDQYPLLGELEPYCRIVALPFPRMARSWPMHAWHLFSRLPYSLVYVDRRFRDLLAEVCRESWDIIQFEFLPFAHYADVLPRSARRVVVEHYIALEARKRLVGLWRWSLRKLYYTWELRKIRAYEQGVLDRFDLCLVTSTAHEALLRWWGVHTMIRVSPNGVDATYFSPLQEHAPPNTEPGPPTLAYMGAFHLEPANIDGLTYLLQDILPLIQQEVPDIRLEIIGKGLPQSFKKIYKANGIHFHGYLDDIRPVLGRARAFVLPLRGGSGTKIRILTAMAMGVPVVATSIAADGIEARDGWHLLIGDDPRVFAQKVVQLLKDPRLHSTIGRAGRRLVEERYTWKRVAEDLDAIYRSLSRVGRN
ncbi:MAG: glycosyltransferase [bacterium]